MIMIRERSLIIPYYGLLILVLLSGYGCTQDSNQDSNENKVSKHHSSNDYPIQLSRILSSQSGISFNNKINDSGGINPFTWNFMYTGGGVGIGDFNEDGFQDIYFCGNFVEDRLYLNQGNWTFKDVTKQAGIICPDWSTGVSVADVNGDGHLDIYVCKNHPSMDKDKLTNKLFINNGKAKFTEAAATFGLADTGYSIQSLFFDMENDGDLDMYLINQPMDAFSKLLVTPQQASAVDGRDKLFINDGNRFTDQTSKYLKNKDAYGLNVLGSDLNDDGFLDLYISNDYDQADELLINKAGRKFDNKTSSSLGHLSLYSMGSDIADIDHDGYSDIVTLDMSYSDHFRSKTNMESMNVERFWSMAKADNIPQYSKNTLQLNQGNLKFKDISHYAGIENTDWSWSVLFSDLNNNSEMELVVTNGIYRDIKNNDFRLFVQQNHGGQVTPQNFLDVLKKLPSTPIENMLYELNDDYSYENIAQKVGFADKGFSTGLAYADLDNDGDLDLITNNTNEPAGVYQNNTKAGNYINLQLEGPKKNTKGIGAKVRVYSSGKIFTKEMVNVRGYFSSVQTDLHFGLGNATVIDSIVTTWNHKSKTVIKNPKINETIVVKYDINEPRTKQRTDKVLFENVALVNYLHKENSYDDYGEQILLPHAQTNNGPYILTEDLNDDNREDLIISGSAGRSSQIFLQQESGQLKPSPSAVLEADKAKEQLHMSIIESENSKLLYAVAGGAQFQSNSENLKHDLYRINKGQLVREKKSKLPKLDGQPVIQIDIDGDKDQDLFVAGRAKANSYPLAPHSMFLVNNKGVFNEASSEVLAQPNIGSVTAGVAVDLDEDGDQDLVLAGEWSEISVLINEGGTFTHETIQTFGHSSRGIWSAMAAGDFDNDGDLDFLVGNLGENNKFHPTVEKPLYLYADDYDGNNSYDVFLAKSYKEKIVPVRGKECSSQQLPSLNQKFSSYTDFAQSSIQEILPIENSDAKRLEINSLASILLENTGKLQFKAHKLPALMQMGPIKDFLVEDINNDGHLDVLYSGNHYNVEVETVRYDGLGGGLALGIGNLKFDCLPSHESGLYFDHDSRDMEWIKIQGEKHLIVSSNNGPLKSYKIKKQD